MMRCCVDVANGISATLSQRSGDELVAQILIGGRGPPTLVRDGNVNEVSHVGQVSTKDRQQKAPGSNAERKALSQEGQEG
jgi:hypothetical protein